MGKLLKPDARKSTTVEHVSKNKEESEKSARESLSKFFYDIAKATFIAMVLGNMATVFGVAEYDGITIVALITGFLGTTTLAYMGNKTLKMR